MQLLTINDVRDAHQRIRDKVHRTPVLTSATLDAMTGAHLFFKCENLQKIGSFKARGAANAVFALTPGEAKRGVATHSSGNHAAALARAARLRGIPAFIVMPRTAPKAKIDSVERNGGQITFCDPTQEARQAAAIEVVAATGATMIHPYDNLNVIAGQGTAGLELLEDVTNLDVVLCPIGGGGLVSGTATVAKALHPQIRMIGVEPAGADDAWRSLQAGHIVPVSKPASIADGLLATLSERTFSVIRSNVDQIVTVSEDAIIKAMRLIWEVMKLLVEPSGAVPLAALLEGRLDVRGRRVGIIVSGGNLDLGHLPWQV